ncbi:MAG: polyketide cyclase [Lachnospiraceae bacterium]|nr:polyketide cyclase [Lachnospiraceae bacterium]
MATSNIQAEFQCDIETIWDKVTSLTDYSWRSDISKIVVTKPGEQFEEHTEDGFVTTFTITAFEKYKRYEFDMDNKNMSGHWTGIFSVHGNTVEIDFTEDVTVKKFFMKPFVKLYLKKQQLQYILELRDAVETVVEK